MTREELAKILEQYTVCVISTIMSNMEPEEQEVWIRKGIDAIADTVMLVNDRKRITRPSAN